MKEFSRERFCPMRHERYLVSSQVQVWLLPGGKAKATIATSTTGIVRQPMAVSQIVHHEEREVHEKSMLGLDNYGNEGNLGQ